jgi:hypothetical protein
MGNNDRPGATRRRFLRGVGLLAAAGAATAVTADRAGAANGNAIKIGDVTNNGSDPTGLSVLSGNSPGYGFGVTDNGLGSVDLISKPTILAHAQGASFDAALGIVGEGQAFGMDVEVGDGCCLFGMNDSTNSATVSLVNQGNGTTLDVTKNDSGIAINAFAFGGATAIVATSAPASGGASGPVVHATQSGNNNAVVVDNDPSSTGDEIAVTNSGTGSIFLVQNLNANAVAQAIAISSFSSGTVLGISHSHSTTTLPTANLSNNGLGSVLVAQVGNAASTAPAIDARGYKGSGVSATANTVPAVIAASTKGVGIKASGKIGGQFSGTSAQLRLTKGGALPATGTVGDVFVDQSGHLHFHNASGWVLLA